MLRHGGLLIKIGQYIASRPDLFPLTYVDTLASLRDQVPARPLSQLRLQLEAAYEGQVDRHLPRIEDEPLAAASFGQVHRAWLADGQMVAVKIQYPGLGASVRVDLRLVRLTLALFKPFFTGWPLDLIGDEISRTSREEQDYLFEGQNADLLRPGVAKHGISVPAVLWEHSREKVLVMAFANGVGLSQWPLAEVSMAERQRVAGMLVDGFLHQLLVEGYFHADPHAGNIIVESDGERVTKLWLIDWGMTARISKREAELYGRFLAALQRNDTDGMVDVLANLGFVLPGADRERLKGLAREVYSELADLNPKTFKGSRRQIELGAKINEFLRQMQGLTFPRHTLMLSRATGLVEGICMDLVPDRNFLDIVRPRLNRFLGPQAQLRWLWEEVQQTWTDLRKLPARVEALQDLAEREAKRPRRDPAILAGIVLLAATQIPPGTTQQVALICAGLGLGLSLLRGGR
jgi:predicted unusual protein kinase regulating ubiquinone biosynthesis (AarF/ABC1/UbiB family)